MINKRIEHLLQKEGLSSTAFAEKVGVQRSGISHILSGRNKPSLDLLQKMLKAFPALQAQWLVSGEGEMYKGNENPIGGLFATENAVADAQNTAKKAPPQSPSEQKPGEVADGQVKDGIDPPVYGYKPTAPHPSGPAISQIVIFYTDGSFSSYKPRI